MNQLNMGFVHFKPVRQGFDGALYHVLIRTHKMVGDFLNLKLLYTGNLETKSLEQQNIQCRRFRSGHINIGPFSTILLAPYLTLQVYRFCRKYNLHFVFNLFDHYEFWAVAIGARLAGAKPIMRVVGKMPRNSASGWRKKLWHAAGDAVERLSILMAWRVLTVTQALSNAIDFTGTAKGKMFVVSQGVDTSFFIPRSDENILTKPHKVLFIGRIVKNKRLDLLLKVLDLLRKEGYAINLKICGIGPLENDFRKKWGSSDWVDFLGHVNFRMLPLVYLDSDLLVLPSMSEGLPNVVLEALSCCVPVVASAVGGIPEMLGHKNGLTATAGDEKEFQSAIRKMLNDAQMRLDCAKNGRQYVLSNHSLDVVRRKFLEIMDISAR